MVKGIIDPILTVDRTHGVFYVTYSYDISQPNATTDDGYGYNDYYRDLIHHNTLSEHSDFVDNTVGEDKRITEQLDQSHGVARNELYFDYYFSPYDEYGDESVQDVHYTRTYNVFDGALEHRNLSIVGTSEKDLAFGGDGNDTIRTGKSNDQIDGGAGRDVIEGGLGKDTLFGRGGADSFVFKTVKDSTVASSGRDSIIDFHQNEHDKIDLHFIDANSTTGGNQAFNFIGSAAFSHSAGELRAAKSGSDTHVSADLNGDGKADFAIVLDFALTMHAGDFVL